MEKGGLWSGRTVTTGRMDHHDRSYRPLEEFLPKVRRDLLTRVQISTLEIHKQD